MSRLPDELMLLIVGFLDLSIDVDLDDLVEFQLRQKTLLSLCLVSKASCALAQPSLYRTFVKYKTPSPFDQSEEQQGACQSRRFEEAIPQREPAALKPMEMFLRTIILQPNLAAQVQYLRIEHFHDPKARPGCKHQTLDSQLADGFIDAMHLTTDPKPSVGGPWAFLEAPLRAGYEGAEVSLLLFLVPNLLSLSIESGSLGQYVGKTCDKLLGPQDTTGFSDISGLSFESPSNFRSQSSHPLPVLSRLETLTIRLTNAGRDSFRLQHCLSLLTLPTLTSFSAQRLEDPRILDFRDSTRLSIPHLQQVKLYDCKICGESITALVESCSSLQTLEIEFHSQDPDDEDGDYEIQTGKEMLQSLRKVSKTLSRLSLTIPKGWTSSYVASPFDLREFDKLRSFEMDMEPLLWYFTDNSVLEFVSDFLPPSLENLAIRNCDICVLLHLEAMASKDFPNLRSVGIGIQPKFPSLYRGDLFEILGDLEVAQGVRNFHFTVWEESLPPNYGYAGDTDESEDSPVDGDD